MVNTFLKPVIRFFLQGAAAGSFLVGRFTVTFGGGFGTSKNVGSAHHIIPVFLFSFVLNCESSKCSSQMW